MSARAVSPSRLSFPINKILFAPLLAVKPLNVSSEEVESTALADILPRINDPPINNSNKMIRYNIRLKQPPRRLRFFSFFGLTFGGIVCFPRGIS